MKGEEVTTPTPPAGQTATQDAPPECEHGYPEGCPDCDTPARIPGHFDGADAPRKTDPPAEAGEVGGGGGPLEPRSSQNFGGVHTGLRARLLIAEEVRKWA